MVEAKDIKFSKADQDAFQHLSGILHLFHHRNKNQHRRSVWWRHFSVFRRQFNGLLEEIGKLNEIPTTHLERVRKKARDKETQSRISQRLDFWQTVLVTECQNSFSQVIADGRFAVLGLVLTAVLAQTCRITGIITAFDDLGQIEVEKVLNQFGEESWEEVLEDESGRNGGEEDVGVAVLRDIQEHDDRKDESVMAVSSKGAADRKVKRKISASTSKTTKKRRKGSNVIDDLFSGLD